jgi:hypothetical protein
MACGLSDPDGDHVQVEADPNPPAVAQSIVDAVTDLTGDRRTARDTAAAVLGAHPEVGAFRVGNSAIADMDLMCLIDAGRFVLGELDQTTGRHPTRTDPEMPPPAAQN